MAPEELKEELYLHLIGWRKGRYSNNTEVLEMLPAFTMYLKPPPPIEKYLVAAILQNENVEISDLPLCLISNMNERTPENIAFLDFEFVERDWIPFDEIFCEIFLKRGKVNI
ncbi:unnamed protein product [Sphagnum balticum]